MSNNHPNRGWRSRWTVDLNTCTATHKDGLVFKFELDELIDGWRGDCIHRPKNIEKSVSLPSRIAREAGKIYHENLNASTKQDRRINNGGHKPKGEIREAITPRVLPETASKLRSIAAREKISIGKVIDAWGEGRLLE